MKNKLFLMATSAVLALGMASCNNDEPVAVNNGRAIVVRTALSRGAEADLKSLKEDGFNLSAITEGKLYIDQVGFTFDKESGTWNANDTYYWPGGDVEFYAYSPGSLSDKCIINSQQQTILDFVPNESVANQVDLITAYAKGNITEYSKKDIMMMFYHRLSQVRVQATRDAGSAYKFQIMGLRIGGVAGAGDFKMPNSGEAETNVQGNWDTNGRDITKYQINIKTPVVLDKTKKSLMNGEGGAMLVPQTCAAWNLKKGKEATGAYISVLLRITKDCPAFDDNGNPVTEELQIYPFKNQVDSDGKVKKYAWASIPVAFDWHPGYKYTYTLNFSGGAGFVDPEENDPDPDLEDPASPVLNKIGIVVDVAPWIDDQGNNSFNWDTNDPAYNPTTPTEPEQGGDEE